MEKANLKVISRKKGWIYLNLAGKNFFKITILLLLLLLLGGVAGSQGVSARWGQDWSVYETENFALFFPDNMEGQARELLYHLEANLDYVRELTGGEVSGKIHLSLEDVGLMANGFADPINERMGIFAGQPDTFSSLAGYESWLRLVGVHELTHILHMTNTEGYSELTTGIFGNALAPNIHSPLWLIEGIAVYAESQISPREGRLNAGYYDGVLARQASENNISELPEITYNHFHHPPGQQYLYGSTFMRYLADEYGEEKFAEFFNEYGSYFSAAGPANFLPALGPDRAAERVYGKNFADLYDEWREWESNRYEDWQVAGEMQLTAEQAELSRLTGHEGNLYFVQSQRYPFSPFNYHGINKLMQYDPETGRSEKLMQTAAGIAGTLQVTDEKIYFLQRETAGGFDNISRTGSGVKSRLVVLDLASGDKSVLTRGEIRDFLVLKEGEKEGENVIYARDKQNGYGSQLIELNLAREEEELLADFDLLLGEIKYSADSAADTVLVTAKERWGSWGIYCLKLSDLTLKPLVTTDWPEMHVSRQEDKVIYTSSYDGYMGIYGYDLEEQEKFKLTRGGYGHEGVMVEGELFYLTQTAAGMGLVQKQLDFAGAEPVDLTAELNGELNAGQQAEGEYGSDEKLAAEIEQLEVESGNFWTENLKQLFPPTLRFPPVFFGGQDAMGMNIYAVNLNPYGSVDLSLQSQLFQPLSLQLQSRELSEGRETRLTGSYPLWQSGPDGLTDIQLQGETDFSRVLAGASMRWRYPRQLFVLRGQADLFTGDFRAGLDYNYLRPEGRIRLGGNYVEGLNLPEDSRLPAFTGDRGYHLRAEYLTRLLSVGRGSWNPNIFLGDIYGGLFVDYLDLAEQQLSGGAKIELEVGTGNAFHLVPGLGITRTRDSWQPFVGLEIGF